MAGQIKGNGLASQVASTVIIGPIDLSTGEADIVLVSKSASGTVTTPTAPKLQIDVDGNGNWVDEPSGSITPSGTSSAFVIVKCLSVLGKKVRVVAAGAFAAGDATIFLHGQEKRFGEM